MDKNNFIFIIDEDLEYAKLIQDTLKKEQFENIMLFDNAETCQKNFYHKPAVIIVNYHIKKITGLQFIQKAKTVFPGIFAIMISEDGRNGFSSFNDERFIKYVDKFIIRGMDDISEMAEALNYNWAC